MSNLSVELRNMAREQGLCDKWFGEWKDDSDNSTLFDKYKRGIDFCISKNYHSLEFMRSHWNKDELEKNGIFLDSENSECKGIKGTFIVNGDSNVNFQYDLFSSADIYVRHDSKIKVNAEGESRIMVNLYDYAEVEVNCSMDAKVYIYNHSLKSKITSIGENEPYIRN